MSEVVLATKGELVREFEVKDKLAQSKWIKVKWSWSQHFNWVRLTSDADGLITNRMFRIDEPVEDFQEYFKQQLMEAQRDLIERLEFIYMARTGQFNDPLDGVEIQL